ncbi:hypothetical protein [Halobacillus seohaensis]|uniref:Uncharacterized protein n=1 Tax=Halobacillus seohaensis TaxID=447421 RepID=A0ABW2EHA6_9BACI
MAIIGNELTDDILNSMEEGIAIVEKKKDLYVFTYGNETILHREPNLLGKSINQFYKDEKEIIIKVMHPISLLIGIIVNVPSNR